SHCLLERVLNKCCFLSYTRTETNVSLSSVPYAPMFCTGLAPTVPGMRDKFSRPLYPISTVFLTESSQFSPAPMVKRAVFDPPISCTCHCFILLTITRPPNP